MSFPRKKVGTDDHRVHFQFNDKALNNNNNSNNNNNPRSRGGVERDRIRSKSIHVDLSKHQMNLLSTSEKPNIYESNLADNNNDNNNNKDNNNNNNNNENTSR